MEMKFKFELTESQFKTFRIVLEDFYRKYCISYNTSKILKNEGRCAFYFNALTEIACLMDELDLEYTNQIV